MMRTDVRTVASHTTVGRFRLVYPLGSTAQVVVVDDHRRYAGIVLVAEAHASEIDPALPIKNILHYTEAALLPTMTVKEAVTAFDKAEAEALAVIESLETRRVVGLLSETYTLRRYSDELELQRQSLVGD
jgi:CIC family chloride channel protein